MFIALMIVLNSLKCLFCISNCSVSHKEDYSFPVRSGVSRIGEDDPVEVFLSSNLGKLNSTLFL